GPPRACGSPRSSSRAGGSATAPRGCASATARRRSRTSPSCSPTSRPAFAASSTPACALPTPCSSRRRGACRACCRPPSSHVPIVRTAAALGGDPDDVLRRVLDVAGLAVDAVLRVDLQPRLRLEVDELVDAGRAIAALRAAIDLKICFYRNRSILELQVRRLVFVVGGVGEGEGGQAVGGEHPGGLGILNRLRLRLLDQGFVIGVIVLERPGRPSAEQDLVDADHHGAEVEALRHPRLEIARLVELLVEPARAKRFGIGRELVAFAPL